MMSHIFIFIHFISFVTGIGFITRLSIVFGRHNNMMAKHIIFGDILYTAFLLIDTCDLYFRKNISNYPDIVPSILDALLFITGFGALYCLTKVIHTMIDRQITHRMKLIFAITAIMIAITATIQLYLKEKFPIIRDYSIMSLSLDLLVAYNLAILMINLRRIKKDTKRLILICIIFVGISVCYSILTSLVNSLPSALYKVPNSPLAYFFLNSIGILYLKKYHLPPESTIDRAINDKTFILNNLSLKYGISEREMEIIALIVDGLNNQDIGKRLFISPNTVKNHVYSVYKKIGIKNRYELISLLNNKNDSVI